MITQKNINRNFVNSSVFEIGPVFYKINHMNKRNMLVEYALAPFMKKSWLEKKRDIDVFDLKADLVFLFKIDEHKYK